MSNILTTISNDPCRLSPFSAVISGRPSRGNNLNTLAEHTLLCNLEKGYLRSLIATIHCGRILQHLKSHREALLWPESAIVCCEHWKTFIKRLPGNFHATAPQFLEKYLDTIHVDETFI